MALNILEAATVLQAGEPTGVITRATQTTTVDELLVARAKAGDEAALETLFRHFEAPVYTLARRISGTRPRRRGRAAGDVPRGRAKHPEFPRRWLARGLDPKGRREQGAHEAAPAGVPRVEDELSPDWPMRVAADRDHGVAPIATAPERLDLEAALARLPDTARVVIWLHDVEGYSHEEIAAMVGKTASFSKSQLSRAHARLREMLAPGWEGPCT